MQAALLILMTGLVYVLGFGALSVLRRQGLSLRFASEGVVLTLVAAALVYAHVPVSPLLFLLFIYAVTVRVWLLVDLGNLLINRGYFGKALGIYRFALRLGPDAPGRRIVLINMGVALLRQGQAQEACHVLEEALAGESARPGAKYLSAGYYNLGLACRRTGRHAEATRCFNQAIDVLPTCLYAQAAGKALKADSGADEKAPQDTERA